ncbi:Ribosome biogenesis protein nsa1 (NOP7-associated protein 1) [Coemansia guatemalensis]|uniref:Ribosome biogenesis protein nsa1 (NOP7-associated protein 1) n=1 Tax=Coemansia guatemalensis TaxID=2761395 RepID=A0A9W8HSD1_9FUNG|nr:Ribosome biogenesis protein nsa1 (NOP7-associated protein 1) [Coemansia guatemalensis]
MGIDIDPKVSLLEAQSRAAKRLRADAKAKAVAKTGKAGTTATVETAADPKLDGINMWTVSGTVSRARGIQLMSNIKWETDTDAFVVGRNNGDVEVVGRNSGQSLYRFNEAKFADKFSIKHNGRFITERRYVGLGGSDSHFLTCTNMGEIRYQSFSGDGAMLMKVGVDACRMRVHQKRPSVFAVGGREQELTVWDADTVEAGSQSEYTKPRSTPVFKSKNVGNDNLDLRMPVWITDMQFMDDNALTPLVAVSTGHRQIRIYDAKTQQRPVHDWEVSKHPIYHILASHVRPELFFADNMGNVQQLDTRMGRVVSGYKGIAGAVKAMAISEDGSMIAAAGLDRFLRVYEAGGMRRPLHRAYIKQRVSQVVWDWDSRDLSSEEIEQKEAEDIWQNMDVLSQEHSEKRPSKRKVAAAS